MSITTIYTVGGLFALVATILSFIFIIPGKRNNNAFFKFLYNLFNFNELFLEKIFKFFYVLSTCFCVIGGFFMLFYVEEYYVPGSYYSSGHYESEWLGYTGLIVMIVGPIVVRIMYEAIMMAILAVKNIININKNVEKIAPKDEVPQAQNNGFYQNPYQQTTYQDPYQQNAYQQTTYQDPYQQAQYQQNTYQDPYQQAQYQQNAYQQNTYQQDDTQF